MANKCLLLFIVLVMILTVSACGSAEESPVKEATREEAPAKEVPKEEAPTKEALTTEEGEGDLFPDLDLQRAIREALDKPEGPIDVSGLGVITSLDVGRPRSAFSIHVFDLTGLEHCTNLAELDLVWNKIVDVSPLASLTELTVLNLGGNKIVDISPLAGLTKSTKLWLFDNRITDISPLASLTNLTVLDLGKNQLSGDISPLASLTNLTELNLDSLVKSHD